MPKLALVWLRRDLRLYDHAALSAALQSAEAVLPVFIFDTTILAGLPADDRRVAFIWHSLAGIKAELQAHGSDLLIRIGDPRTLIPQLAAQLGAQAVHCNRDYEPQAIARDQYIGTEIENIGLQFNTHKDQVIFERNEILTRSGSMYSVFTPYKRAWLARVTATDFAAFPVKPLLHKLQPRPPEPMPTLAEIGFADACMDTLRITAGSTGAASLWQDFQARMGDYHLARDFPAAKGVSYLSTHLRFGTVSIRELAGLARHAQGEGAATWLSELIWREFYQQLLWHRPDVVSHAFLPQFEHLTYENNSAWFAAWCEGRTGFPIVDAAMRQLAHSGYMHNRLRMIVASFLTKDLLIDWRWGEAYFARQLLDFDLASNNGGWQWAASTGCDAQPWFRIFNPVTQSQRFDPQGKFIRRYCPELSGLPDKYIHAPHMASPQVLAAAGVQLGVNYPQPLIDHAIQRDKALAMFKAASNSKPEINSLPE